MGKWDMGSRAREAMSRPARNPLFADPGDSESEQVTKAALRFGVQETSRLVLQFIQQHLYRYEQIDSIRVWFDMAQYSYRIQLHGPLTKGFDGHYVIPEEDIVRNSESKTQWGMYMRSRVRQMMADLDKAKGSPAMSWSQDLMYLMYIEPFEENGILGAVATREGPLDVPVSEEEERAAIESIKRSWKWCRCAHANGGDYIEKDKPCKVCELPIMPPGSGV